MLFLFFNPQGLTSLEKKIIFKFYLFLVILYILIIRLSFIYCQHIFVSILLILSILAFKFLGLDIEVKSKEKKCSISQRLAPFLNYVIIFNYIPLPYSFFHLEFLPLPTTSIFPSTLNFSKTLFIVASPTSGHIVLISFLVK